MRVRKPPLPAKNSCCLRESLWILSPSLRGGTPDEAAGDGGASAAAGICCFRLEQNSASPRDVGGILRMRRDEKAALAFLRVCAATLDTLMGRDRNEYGVQTKKGLSFKGDSVRRTQRAMTCRRWTSRNPRLAFRCNGARCPGV